MHTQPTFGVSLSPGLGPATSGQNANACTAVASKSIPHHSDMLRPGVGDKAGSSVRTFNIQMGKDYKMLGFPENLFPSGNRTWWRGSFSMIVLPLRDLNRGFGELHVPSKPRSRSSGCRPGSTPVPFIVRLSMLGAHVRPRCAAGVVLSPSWAGADGACAQVWALAQD